MSAIRDDPVADPRLIVAELRRERDEALARETAMAEVLQVINSSPGDLATVFDAILEKATRICEAVFGVLLTWDGERLHRVAFRGVPTELVEALREPMTPVPGTIADRLVRGERVIATADLREAEYTLSGPGAQAFLRHGARSCVHVALHKEERLLGSITVYREEVRPFTTTQIALLQNFAAQAVIAIENARLLTETREALEQQTATAEVLQVINSSPGDLSPVFDAILDRAHNLCGAELGALFTYDGECFLPVAAEGVSSRFGELMRDGFRPGPGNPFAGVLEGEPLVHIADIRQVAAQYPDDPGLRVAVEIGLRTFLIVPLRKDDVLLGAITANRREVRPFSQNQIALLQNFAAQAVIAMENARLLDELRQRTADLARSVDELTATGDVLKTISRSSVDLETVLDTLSETVMRLCRADHVYMFRRRDDKNHLVASRGLSQEAKEFVHTHPFAPDRSTLSGRVSLERRVVHIPDVFQDLEYAYEGLKIFDYRTMLGVPLLREDALIGIFVVARTRVQPFTDKEIELATGFADQAVIAIENARLIEQLRDRQAELRVTFDNMGDGVAMFGSDTRLVAWNRNFQTILDLPDELVAQRPTYVDFVRLLAERGEFGTDDIEGELSRRLQDTDRELRLERSRPDGRVIEVRRNTVPGGGFVLIYADVTERKHAEQAIRAAHDAAQAALRDLQAAQARLVHAQKMAALGQLTAGIAHEIKNPLNFVNNFADLSVELFDELKEAMAQVIGALDTDKRIEILETIGTLGGNLEKIAEHGRRADGIVRSMLQHSRGSSGDWLATDLNALVEESLKLAYHGARAQDQDFKITLELDLDRNLAPIEVVSQDVGRVLLNLISNGFYAVTKRGLEADPAFRPHLKIATRDFGKGVEIRVRDNGVGIPAESCEKLFQPFFTTKPTGEGTGLGLSISYEIITQQHGGTITVDSEVGEFTQFTVRLPRRRLGLA